MREFSQKPARIHTTFSHIVTYMFQTMADPPGFRVRDDDTLAVYKGLIGCFKQGEFLPTTNFSFKVRVSAISHERILTLLPIFQTIGLIRQEVNGYAFLARFPGKKEMCRFFVPSADYTRPAKFTAHLKEQYKVCTRALNAHNIIKRYHAT